MEPKTTVRVRLGATALDLPRFVYSMRPARSARKGRPWVFFSNRNETLAIDAAGIGARCNWQWTSDLHIAKVFPALGRRLMKRAFTDWPVKLKRESPLKYDSDIQVSFVIGHRGKARLPHLLETVGCIAAQRNCAFECIVVEQSRAPEIKDALPGWVRYIYTPLPISNMPYSRAWALNAGARAALGEVLVLHDNDLLIPEHYASEILARVAEGYEVVDLKRFIFYLNGTDTAGVLSGDMSLDDVTPERVLQNAKGGSLAITRQAYRKLGGFDEAFVGWGGEDDEFWERAQTRSVWPYGYMPLIHLWHDAPEGKVQHGELNMELLNARSAIPVRERIQRLSDRAAGRREELCSSSALSDTARHTVSIP